MSDDSPTAAPPSKDAARPFWRLDQLAKRWGVSTRTVRRMVDEGELRAVRIRNQLRIAADIVDRYEGRRMFAGTPGRRFGKHSAAFDVRPRPRGDLDE